MLRDYNGRLIRVQANAVISRQYAKRYADQGVISIALNPGEGASFARRRLRPDFSWARQHPNGSAAPHAHAFHRCAYSSASHSASYSTWLHACSQSKLMLYPAERGALTQLYAGTMPEAVNHNGGVSTFPLSSGCRGSLVVQCVTTVHDSVGARGAMQAGGVRRCTWGTPVCLARG